MNGNASNGESSCHLNGHCNGENGSIEVVQNGVVDGFENVKIEDATQYLNNYKAHKKGITHEEMIQVYSDWANNYDKDLCPGRYNGPEIAAEFAANVYLPNVREAVTILDVAAGTGRVGHELYKQGFRIMDALEPSPGMLQVLRMRNIYRHTFQQAIGFKRIEAIKSNSYDALIIAGGMGEGHIPVSAVDEMIRVVKPGGTVFIVMREEYLSYVQEYVGKLEPYMEQLAEKGMWEKTGRTIVPNYSFNKDGVVFSYKVLSDRD